MKKGLNGFQLKIIACIAMVIDHVGAVFYPHMEIFRIIGRLAFPIFAFFIAEGFFHTRSVKKYLARLGACAVVFQIPDWFSRIYSAVFNVPGFGVNYKFNIFATLFFGLLAILLYDRFKAKSVWLSWALAATVAVTAEITGADYGAYGVLYITVFYLTRENVNKMIPGVLTLHVVFTVYGFAIRLSHARAVFFYNPLQLYSLLAVPLIALYNRERGYKLKYFFYVFYPLHLIIIYVIYWLVQLK